MAFSHTPDPLLKTNLSLGGDTSRPASTDLWKPDPLSPYTSLYNYLLSS